MLKKLIDSRIFRNFSYLTLGTALSQLISLFAILKITHILAPESYGTFSFLMVQGALLASIADVGMRNILIRSIARDPLQTSDLVVTSLMLRLLALVLITALYLLYNYFFGKLSHLQIILIFSFSFFSCFSNLFENVFIGRERMLSPSLINFSYSLLWFGSIYLMPAKSMNVVNFFYVFVFLNALKAFFFFISLKFQKHFVGKVGVFRRSSLALLKQSWPYFVLTVIMLPFTMLSNNFLDLNSTLDQVGFFNLSNKLIGPVSLVVEIGLAAIFPGISAAWFNEKAGFHNLVSNVFKYFMLLSLVLCFVFTLFSREIVQALFPIKYFGAVKVSQLQIWYLFLASIDSLIGTIFGAVNKEKMTLKLGIFKAVFCTPFLYYGSQYGALGLSWGYVASVAIFQVLLWFVFVRETQVRIRHNGIFWILSVFLFILSYFLLNEVSLLYKLAAAFIVIAGTGIYFFRKPAALITLR